MRIRNPAIFPTEKVKPLVLRETYGNIGLDLIGHWIWILRAKKFCPLKERKKLFEVEELGVKFGIKSYSFGFLSKLTGLDMEPDSEKSLDQSESGSNKFNKFGYTALQFLA